jgi:galactokinase
VREIEQRVVDAFERMTGSQPDVVASAPGRVNLIGEHTDYSGGFVLPCAIDKRVAVAASRDGDTLYAVDMDETQPLETERTESWADYPSGVRWAFQRKGYCVPTFRAAFAGDVPRGSGLSSSAAIECATAVALDALYDLHISRREMALLAQTAENGFVGVNSGVMDQYASLLSRAGAALFIDTRSLDAEVVPLDLASRDLSITICDTRVPRGLGRTAYNERRATTELAARQLGADQLRDVTEEDLGRLQGDVLRRARHVVTENQRVLQAVAALRRNDFVEFGRLMYASHASLRDDYEVSIRELDVFVDVAARMGALGARLTGAGFGGCAIALIATGRVGALEAAVEEEFRVLNFREPAFYPFRPEDGAEVVQ